jgi:adenine-specific DNA methylase
MQKWTTHDRQAKLSAASRERFEKARQKPALFKDLVQLRGALLDFIADFADFDNANVEEYLMASQSLTSAAHAALTDQDTPKPLLLDPFAGGGAIPLEGLRVGADAFASDINPVAVLLNRVILEYMPKYGSKLASEVEKWSTRLHQEAEKELADLYPSDPDGAKPIAYLWARTMLCEGPACGARVPLVSSFWVAETGKERVALAPLKGKSSQEPRYRLLAAAKASEVPPGTVRRGAGTCPFCGFTTARERVQQQMVSQAGGVKDSTLLCVVLKTPGKSGRKYRLPTPRDLHMLQVAHERLIKLAREDNFGGLPALPTEELPYLRSIFNVHIYGMRQWRDLFNDRQLLALLTFARLARQAHAQIAKDTRDPSLAKAVASILALGISRMADHLNSGCSWNAKGPKLQHLFTRQALGMIWDYAEANPFGGSVGDWLAWVSGLSICFDSAASASDPGQAVQSSACQHPLPSDACDIVVTDPPYYDAVPYANLSDFFYVWLRRVLSNVHTDLFQKPLTPKEGEIVQLAERNPSYSYKTKEYFERLMCEALTECRRILKPSGIAVLFFAHKGTSAWEAQLKATIDAGWTVVASWPIDTEMKTRLRAMDSAVLASSIELVMRPRENSDGSVHTSEVGDWRDVLAELPRRIHDWMPRLSEEGVVGADSIFACLGPALEIFSRYSRVEKASGEAVTLKEYLEQIWAAVAKEALTMIFTGADATGFEEDARLTAMWLWTLKTDDQKSEDRGQSAEEDSGDEEEGSGKRGGGGGFVLEFDAARKIAQGLGAHLEDLASLVAVEGETARLLPVAERANHLFGKDEGKAAPIRRKRGPQMELFKPAQDTSQAEPSFGETKVEKVGATVLDRVHQSMILFAAGRSEALKRFLVEDGAGNNTRFWTLAQALSALYPSSTDEKRWVDGVLARKKGLGF